MHAVGAVGGRSTGGLVGFWYFCFHRGAFRRPLPSDVIVLHLPVKFVLALAEVDMADKVVVRVLDFSTPFLRT